MAANLIRSAKSGSDWTQNDLDTYHIEIIADDPTVFFGVNPLPVPVVDPELLTTADAQDMQQDRNAELINLLDLAMIPPSGESAVVDFSVELLKVLGYVRRNRVARTRKDLTLFICGERKHAKTDVCIVDRSQNDITLLVQEDRRLEDRDPLGARAQLVAEAVAAFEENNENRVAAGQPRLTEKLVPGIIMVGTSPTFFKVPVTQDLCTHIAHGTYPSNITRVSYCLPPVPRPNRRRNGGMKPLDNRREICSLFPIMQYNIYVLPPTILLTADHDDRVVLLYSFKLAVTLQANKADNTHTLLIRIDKKAGHGAGKSTEKKANLEFKKLRISGALLSNR